MNKKYITLIGRIENELEEIEEIVAKIKNGWEKYNIKNDELYLDSVALNLHDYYSAFERIFELIANEIDESLPKVISKKSEDKLDEFRGFRHVVRNVYSYKFSGDKIEKLVKKLDELNNQLLEEIEEFIIFLEEAASE